MTSPAPEPPIPAEVLARARSVWPCQSRYGLTGLVYCGDDEPCNVHAAIARALLAERERALEEAAVRVEQTWRAQHPFLRIEDLSGDIRALKAGPR